MSRFLPCCVETPEISAGVRSSQGTSPFSLSVQFSYASFFQFPRPIHEDFPPDRKSLFGNAGLGVDATYLFTREFGVTAGVQILSSIRDYNGRLKDDFSTLRGFAGGDFGVELGDFNLGSSFSLEFARLGRFVAWDNRQCVVREDDCTEREDGLIFDRFNFLMGVNARPRVSWNFFKAYHAVASFSLTYYFFPLSSREVNYPVTGQLGVMYRF